MKYDLEAQARMAERIAEYEYHVYRYGYEPKDGLSVTGENLLSEFPTPRRKE